MLTQLWNHKIVWDGRDLKYHLVASPCHGHVPLEQVVPCAIQPGLEHFRRYSILPRAFRHLDQITFLFQQCHWAPGCTLPGLSDGRCGYQGGNSHLAASLWGCRDLHWLVGLGKESHPDDGEGPDSYHTIQVRATMEQRGCSRQPESCILLQEPLSLLSWAFQWWSWVCVAPTPCCILGLHPGV